MKRIFPGALILLCLTVLIPAAFAGEDAADFPRFNPTLRPGCAVDAGNTHYTFVTKDSPLGNLDADDLTRPSHPRFYIAAGLPFAVTDRLAVTLDGAWSFSGSQNDVFEYGTGTDGAAHWVTADLLVSYALIKDTPVVKDLSAVAGIRWDYQSMALHHPHDNNGFLDSPLNTIDFRMQTLAPVFGLNCTVAGPKSGVWGGDIKLAVLAGPIVWGSEDYTETFGSAPYITMRFRGDFYRGYIVDVLAEGTLLSGKIAPGVDASLAAFCRYTRTSAKGTVRGTLDSTS